ncbi:GNAT family N-acetyltransferase [Sphingomonas sp. NCPPB 2930]
MPAQPAPALALHHDTAAQRFEAQREGRTLGHLAYETAADGALVITHTIVPPEHAGQGVASFLARGVLDDVRTRGLQVVPECSFVAGWLQRHPDYLPLVQPAARERLGL